MWPQFRTPQKDQSNPTFATPDVTKNNQVGNAVNKTNTNNNNNSSIYPSSNRFDALASDSSTVNSRNHDNNGTDEDSISTMSSTAEESCLISLETLKSKMESIEPGVTTPNSKPTYMDIVIFQETMGNAVAGLAVYNQTFGFLHLVDTTERFQQRCDDNTTTPNDMPKPPTPLVGDKKEETKSIEPSTVKI